MKTNQCDCILRISKEDIKGLGYVVLLISAICGTFLLIEYALKLDGLIK